ncbi:MAG: TonB-dependent receptor [Thermoanaerobaculia bacterium]
MRIPFRGIFLSSALTTAWLCALSAVCSESTAPVAGLSGVVRDDDGKPLPGVRVELRLAPGVAFTTFTSSAGTYALANVPAGTADLAFRLPGFATLKRKNVVLSAGTTATSDATLHLTTSADVVVTGKRTFHNLADLDTPVNDLIGIASASTVGVITAEQIDERETHRPADVLESVPGFLVSQHSGEGKANQYYLRGFNLDHGTDVATTVAGVPVNMPTHAHGQGYSDSNFLIPELVSGIQYKKGPYYADEGDFSAAGAVNVNYVNVLDNPIVELSAGVNGYRRGLFAGSTSFAGGTILGALELYHNDGPWTNPDDYRKVNGVVRWSTGDQANGFSVTGVAYQGGWNSTDQIAERGVAEGLYGRFDAIDPTDGGKSHRYGLSAQWESTGYNTQTRAEAYVVDYSLDLWNNFTYFLSDPVNGDQFEQVDRRVVTGFKASRQWLLTLFGRDVEATAGFQLRNDNIPTVALYDTKARNVLTTVTDDHVAQTSGALHGQASIQIAPKFRAILGLRGDLYRFDVHSNIEENSGTDTRGIFSPKLSLVFGPFSNTELYVNGGYGFHSNDGRGTTLTVDPKTFVPLDKVKPLVRAKGAEVGVRSNYLQGFQTTFSAWLLDLDSELVFSGDAGITEPSRASRRVGFEWANYRSLNQWITLDADLAFSRARFTQFDPVGDHIPGAIEGVASAGLSVSNLSGFFGSVRYRYFGPRALIEDDSVRSAASTEVNLRAGHRVTKDLHVTLDVFNLFNQQSSDIDYYYTSRLPGEPLDGLNDIHFHPVEKRSFRASLAYSF